MLVCDEVEPVVIIICGCEVLVVKGDDDNEVMLVVFIIITGFVLIVLFVTGCVLDGCDVILVVVGDDELEFVLVVFMSGCVVDDNTEVVLVVFMSVCDEAVLFVFMNECLDNNKGCDGVAIIIGCDGGSGGVPSRANEITSVS